MRYAVIFFIAALPLSGCASNFAGPQIGSQLTAQTPVAQSRHDNKKAATKGWVQAHPGVRLSGLSRRLKAQLADIGKHFGKPVQVVSGCRSPQHNRRVGGVNKSFHLRCLAADFYIPGVSKKRLAKYVRALPQRGGMGVYCGKSTVHLDLGPRRSWYQACAKRPNPVTRTAARTSPAKQTPRLGLTVAGSTPDNMSAMTKNVGNTAMTTSLGPGIEALIASHR